MSDTPSSYSTPLVTTTIANGATWTSFTITEYQNGLIKFLDSQGNVIHSKQKSLRQLVDVLKLKKLS